MKITLGNIEKILKKENLLKEFVYHGNYYYDLPIEDKTIKHLSYNSKKVEPTTLFFCKGMTFKEDYLNQAIEKGLNYYISETDYQVSLKLGIIVTDIRKAMAVISMNFFDLPQNKLTLIGITGTKGKTTTAYFTKAILDEFNHQKTAMLSTMNTTLDGETFFKSSLTTPESLDLYEMMAKAVENNMTHLVMEVSSQAYKLERVFGLTFDIGVFLNISPDHISPVEHPTFDDYFYCKRQLINNSKQMILNADCKEYPFLKELVESRHIPCTTYGVVNKLAEYTWSNPSDHLLDFQVDSVVDSLRLKENYTIKLMGDFNKDNALASLIVAKLLGASNEHGKIGLAKTIVPGRMEYFAHPNGANIIIDYAHNYLSLKSLLSFAKEMHPKGRVITVIGSTGGKAISRREDFGKVLSSLADIAILTSDDPAFEDPEVIAKEIGASIHNKDVQQIIILDREEAIKIALEMARDIDSVVLAGKGHDLYQKINGEDVPYIGDSKAVQDFIDNFDD